MHPRFDSIAARIRNFTIRNEAFLLLLTLFNCALLMNFHDLFWNRQIMVGFLLVSVVVNLISFKIWIATIGSVCISFIFFAIRFPRLANHATIEFRRGYFVVTDRSTNGTYVQLGDDDELRLHRDELQLRKSGKISLGQAVDKDPTDVLYFQCVG